MINISPEVILEDANMIYGVYFALVAVLYGFISILNVIAGKIQHEKNLRMSFIGGLIMEAILLGIFQGAAFFAWIVFSICLAINFVKTMEKGEEL